MSGDPESDLEFTDFGQLTAADFEAQLNTGFAVDLNYLGLAVDGKPLRRDDAYPDGADLRLELTKVTRKQAASEFSQREPYFLLFRGSHDVPLFSDVHVLVHESLGKLSLLLTAVSVTPGIHPTKFPGGRFYQAVIG